MGLWAGFVLLFAGMWLLQIVLAQRQSRHAQRQLRELMGQSSGFLGVGVHKRRLGSGAVVILVADRDGVVTACRRMSGMSVFARFRDVPELTGKRLEECRAAVPSTPAEKALAMAVEKIEEARLKALQGEAAAEKTG